MSDLSGNVKIAARVNRQLLWQVGFPCRVREEIIGIFKSNLNQNRKEGETEQVDRYNSTLLITEKSQNK